LSAVMLIMWIRARVGSPGRYGVLVRICGSRARCRRRGAWRCGCSIKAALTLLRPESESEIR
jgi:hypothetical protein